MESLSETEWDAVISGTGLHQSLLALALSRSGKNILHVDRNNYYGGNEAALSLHEADDWAMKFSSLDADAIFTGAEVHKDDGISSSRAYSLALAPQLIHAKSDLLEKLVSSKAFRQLEFLAVGSFFIYQPPSDDSKPSLARIPATREDVFANKAIPPRPQRLLMKFLKFVLDYQSETQTAIWVARKDKPLADFLASEFKLDTALQSYILTLTLSPDGQISVENGLFVIHRHLTSMGVFGPGFAAVYPKWGGLSEIAQVGCRASAVGGAIYMLGTGIKTVKQTEMQADTDRTLTISLDNDCNLRSKVLFQERESRSGKGPQLSRLTAVISSPLSPLFQTVVEGAPTPSVSIVAFPAKSVSLDGEIVSTNPVYAVLHSADTGECPAGQSVIYLSTPRSSTSKDILQQSLTLLLDAIEVDGSPKVLYRLSYHQASDPEATLQVSSENIATFGPLPLDIAFNDSSLSPVKSAWDLVEGRDRAADTEYLVFDDREGANDEDDVFDG